MCIRDSLPVVHDDVDGVDDRGVEKPLLVAEHDAAGGRLIAQSLSLIHISAIALAFHRGRPVAFRLFCCFMLPLEYPSRSRVM